MYKVFYKDKLIDDVTLDNIDSISIDVKDIDNMKYIDIVKKSDINLLILYVKCLKYYHTKPKLNDEFTINNNFSDNRNIIASILNCSWLINEDDVINNLEKLEEIENKFQMEIDLLNNSTALKDIHRVHLMKYFINSLNQAKRKKEIVKKKIKK